MTLKEAKAFARWLAVWVAVAMVATTVVSMLPLRRDSTDPEGIGRSGMILTTDSLTGCQYLASPYGGITPRISPKGEHLGCKNKEPNANL